MEGLRGAVQGFWGNLLSDAKVGSANGGDKDDGGEGDLRQLAIAVDRFLEPNDALRQHVLTALRHAMEARRAGFRDRAVIHLCNGAQAVHQEAHKAGEAADALLVLAERILWKAVAFARGPGPKNVPMPGPVEYDDANRFNWELSLALSRLAGVEFSRGKPAEAEAHHVTAQKAVSEGDARTFAETTAALARFHRQATGDAKKHAIVLKGWAALLDERERLLNAPDESAADAALFWSPEDDKGSAAHGAATNEKPARVPPPHERARDSPWSLAEARCMLLEEKLDWAAHVDDFESVAALAGKLSELCASVDAEYGRFRPENAAVPKGVRRHAAALCKGKKQWQHYVAQTQKLVEMLWEDLKGAPEEEGHPARLQVLREVVDAHMNAGGNLINANVHGFAAQQYHLACAAIDRMLDEVVVYLGGKDIPEVQKLFRAAAQYTEALGKIKGAGRYKAREEKQKVEALFEEAVGIFEDQLARRALAYHQLGAATSKLAQAGTTPPGERPRIFRQSIDAFKTSLGTREVSGGDPSEGLETLNFLGTTLGHAGELDEGTRVLEEALRMGREATGDDSPYTKRVLHSLVEFKRRASQRAKSAPPVSAAPPPPAAEDAKDAKAAPAAPSDAALSKKKSSSFGSGLKKGFL